MSRVRDRLETDLRPYSRVHSARLVPTAARRDRPNTRQGCLMGGWWGQYSFQCQPVDKSNSPTAIRSVGWNVGKSACMSVGVGSGMSSSTCAIYHLTTFFQHLDTALGDHVTLTVAGLPVMTSKLRYASHSGIKGC
uniref:Uncharacterized protein n=1 Tax=Timema poppense TaxID=170557 RepID=A0A7R9CPF3_TIMPO|nr:unnamed protein product [Timema poppensis]